MSLLNTVVPAGGASPESASRPACSTATTLPAEVPGQGYQPLDAFRGLVCLQIVMVHALATSVQPQLEAVMGATGMWAAMNVRFGFGAFFVLAGFFLAQSFRPGDWASLSVSRFLTRRMLRLMVPYWAAIAVGVIGFELSAALRGRPYAVPPVRELLALGLFVHDVLPAALPSVTYWFMAPLVQFYLLWAGAFWAVRRWHLRRGTADYHAAALRVLVPLTAAAVAGSMAVHALGLQPRWRAADCGVYLGLGCLAFWTTCGVLRARWLVLAAVAVAALGVYTENSRLVASGVAAVLVPALSRSRRLPGWPPLRALAVVGGVSYSVYLTHTYFLYRVANLPAHFGQTVTPLGAFGLVALMIAGSVALGAVFYRLVERPLAARSRRLQYRTGPSGDGR